MLALLRFPRLTKALLAGLVRLLENSLASKNAADRFWRQMRLAQVQRDWPLSNNNPQNRIKRIEAYFCWVV